MSKRGLLSIAARLAKFALLASLSGAVVYTATSGPSFASGGGGGGSGAGGGSAGGGSAGGSAGGAGGGNGGAGIYRGFSPDVCPQGYALDQRRRVCVRAHAGILPDEDLYQQGRALALSGFYGQALLILDAVSRTDDSMVYTMRGYATRKLGSFAAGMELYQKALAIDPNNINTHEYIGEGYVSAGRVDRARVDWPNSKPYAAFIANNMRTLRKQ
jgi:hypothetical protein